MCLISQRNLLETALTLVGFDSMKRSIAYIHRVQQIACIIFYLRCLQNFIVYYLTRPTFSFLFLRFIFTFVSYFIHIYIKQTHSHHSRTKTPFCLHFVCFLLKKQTRVLAFFSSLSFISS